MSGPVDVTGPDAWDPYACCSEWTYEPSADDCAGPDEHQRPWDDCDDVAGQRCIACDGMGRVNVVCGKAVHGVVPRLRVVCAACGGRGAL